MTELQENKTHPALKWLAYATPLITLFTILFGALTTTKNAGMAFPDWPTSDGQNMITYPWFSLFPIMAENAEAYAKFLEHGHRLAGIVIGLVSIALVVVAFIYGQRKWMKVACIGVLVAVIAQGLLGGFRVQLNQRGLAMVHGLSAAFVFSLMCFVAVATSKKWMNPVDGDVQGRSLGRIRGLAIATVVVLTLQYTLGGLIRHHGKAVNEHLGFGFVALILCLVTMVFAVRSGISWVRNSGVWLGAAIVSQFALGLFAYATKFGVASWGIVAVADSGEQILARTAHMMGGVLVMAAAFLVLAKTMRVQKTIGSEEPIQEINTDHSNAQLKGEPA